MNEIEKIITPILAQYINDAECKVFHSHDDVFLAQKIAQQICDALIPQGDGDLRENIIRYLHHHVSMASADEIQITIRKREINFKVDDPEKWYMVGSKTWIRMALNQLIALTKSLEPQIEGDGDGLVNLEKAEGDLSFPTHLELSPDGLDVIRLWALAYGDRVRKAQASLSIRLEREKVVRDLNAIDREADDVREFTKRVCDLIVEYEQSLKGGK